MTISKYCIERAEIEKPKDFIYRFLKDFILNRYHPSNIFHKQQDAKINFFIYRTLFCSLISQQFPGQKKLEALTL